MDCLINYNFNQFQLPVAGIVVVVPEKCIVFVVCFTGSTFGFPVTFCTAIKNKFLCYVNHRNLNQFDCYKISIKNVILALD